MRETDAALIQPGWYVWAFFLSSKFGRAYNDLMPLPGGSREPMLDGDAA